MNIDKAPTTIGTKRPGETRPTRDSPRAAPVPPQTPSSRQAQPPRPIPFNPRVQSSSIQDAQSSTPYERTHVDFGAIDPFGNAQNSTSKLAPTLSIREWVIGATNFVKNALAFVRDVPSEADLLNNPDFGPIYRELKLVLGDMSASPAVTQVAVSTPTQSTPTPNDERDPKIYAILESISERLQTIENTTTTTKSTSYAAAAGKAVNQSKPTPKNIGPHPDFKPIPSPSQRHHPARLVIQATTPMDPSHRLTVLATRDKINEALDGTGAPKPLRVVAVRWNEKGNCIVMVQDDQRAADLMPYVDSFAHLVCGTSAWTAVPDQAWTRVLVHGVDTGMSDSDMNDTPDNSTELHEELVRSNPWLANVKLGCATRWLAKPETVATKHHSSIIISFCDEEDANTLINRRRGLFAFGRFAKVNRYVDSRYPNRSTVHSMLEFRPPCSRL